MKPIDISNNIGLILIGEGIEYTNQCGGQGCFHFIEKGTFIPLNIMDFSLDKYFSSRPELVYGLDEEAIKYIESYFRHINYRYGDEYYRLCIDRSKLDKSYEAWIYAIMNVFGDDTKDRACVFVFNNSD